MGEGGLSPKPSRMCVHKMEEHGYFLFSMEGEVYGSVLSGDDTIKGSISGFEPSICELHCILSIRD